MPDLQDAITLLEKGDAQEASTLLKAMAAEMPGYATARVLLARAYEGLGEWPNALSAWREALQIVPNSPVIRRGLERAARKAASRAPVDELPSMSVSAPASGEISVSDATGEALVDERSTEGLAEVSAERTLADDIPEPSGDELSGSEEGEGADDEIGAPSRMYGPGGAGADAPPQSPEADAGPEGEAEGLPSAASAPPHVEAEAAKLEAEVRRRSGEASGEDADRYTEAKSFQEEEEEDRAEEREPENALEQQGRSAVRPSDEDLDRLIAELESARIVPRPDVGDMPEPELEDDIEDVVSVTLARIYASQGQYDAAARVYELLATQQPESEGEFMARAAEMRTKASEE